MPATLGACRRTLESFPSHPGLYLLSGFARLLLPNQEVEQALNDIRSGFQNLTDLPVTRQEEITLEFLRKFEQWFESIQNFEMIQANIAEIVLDALQARAIAHAIYRINPVYAERILLNWILQDVKNFNQQFLGELKMPDNSDFLKTETVVHNLLEELNKLKPAVDQIEDTKNSAKTIQESADNIVRGTNELLTTGKTILERVDEVGFKESLMRLKNLKWNPLRMTRRFSTELRTQRIVRKQSRIC